MQKVHMFRVVVVVAILLVGSLVLVSCQKDGGGGGASVAGLMEKGKTYNVYFTGIGPLEMKVVDIGSHGWVQVETSSFGGNGKVWWLNPNQITCFNEK